MQQTFEKINDIHAKREIDFQEFMVGNTPELPISYDLSSVHDRLADIEHDVGELTDLSANKYVELSDQCEKRCVQLEELYACSKDVLRNDMVEFAASSQQVVSLKERLAALDEKIGAELDTRMLNVLQAAIVPLAEKVSVKLVEFETNIATIVADPDTAPDITGYHKIFSWNVYLIMVVLLCIIIYFFHMSLAHILFVAPLVCLAIMCVIRVCDQFSRFA